MSLFQQTLKSLLKAKTTMIVRGQVEILRQLYILQAKNSIKYTVNEDYSYFSHQCTRSVFVDSEERATCRTRYSNYSASFTPLTADRSLTVSVHCTDFAISSNKIYTCQG